MRLVIRADDVGYTDVCNIGTFETIKNGVVTSVDIMLDTPGTIDALNRLREFPWISVGWHTHFWGAPVLGLTKVPSMVDIYRSGFRKDLHTSMDVDYEEALSECRAQIERCIRILGRAPDVGNYPDNDSPFARALRQVHNEYNIVANFMSIEYPVPLYKLDEKWSKRKIVMRGLLDSVQALKDEPLNEFGWTDSILALENYDPIKFYTEDKSKLKEINDDSITVHAWHPGYVDYYVYRLGDYSPASKCFIQIRTVDVHALCSHEVKEWLEENKVELINMRDALLGTSEFQNHLQAINSKLFVK